MTITISSFTCSTQSQCITLKAYIYILKFYQNLLTKLFVKQCRRCQCTFCDKGLFLISSLRFIPNDNNPAHCHAYIKTFKRLNYILFRCVWVLLLISFFK